VRRWGPYALATALIALSNGPVWIEPAWAQTPAASTSPPASTSSAIPVPSLAMPAPAAPTDPMALAIFQRIAQINAQGGVLPQTQITLGKAVADVYTQRQYLPLWTDTGDVQQLLDNLRGLDQDGLDPADFRAQEITDAWNRMVAGATTPAQRADFEMLTTSACISALVQLSRGKVDPVTLGPNANFDPAALDTSLSMAILDGLNRQRVSELFAQARPKNPLYAQLRASLTNLRQLAATVGWPSIAEGPTLKPGMTDPRVISLRQRLIAENYLDAAQASGNNYDDTVKAAVERFQRDQYLKADGEIGLSTLAVLNIPVSARIGQLRVNLERARWLLRELQGTFVIVDIAGYKIAYYRDGQPVWRSRVQVGKPYRSTPIFKSEITYVTFNPTWTVPPTILRKDIIPKVRKNPGYLAANRIRAIDASGQQVAVQSVDWSNPRGITLRQDAGPGNSLGEVAIRFPNPFSVYLHDTPHRELFDKEQRDTSSGCIRVENPLDLVQLLFDEQTLWNPQTIAEHIATGKTHNVSLPKPVPILLAYWTVDVADDGRVSFKPDVYGRDASLLTALDRPRPVPSL
jgi:murein L,D-transpeptidase YcbB/YkuD